MLAPLLCLAALALALDLFAPWLARTLRAARRLEMARRHDYLDRTQGD